MRREQTEVLVIGGGATGTGVLRDLAMRGIDALLVEQRDLSHGTSGRYHGLLHSGGRYVVKDPEAAVECIEENRVLRRIMPHCLEDTSGFFVVTPWDDTDYVARFLEGCRAAGIPVADVRVSEALRREPYLNPAITHCFEVPDASADSFLAAESTAASARDHGARVLNYHEVTELIRDGATVVGARCRDLVGGEDVEISADMVVNASGAWAGRIAATAGVDFEVQAGKGTMLAVNHRMVNTVVNRCKMPDDGDIIVPIRTVAVIGTTDEGVPHPERFSVEPWEVRLMMEEGEKLVPGISSMRILRAWAGVRPLYQEKAAADDTRDVTRAYALLDHTTRDGVEGLVTITGGKWTTFRQMAEVTVDSVCSKLGVDRTCRTHLEPLPDPRGGGGYHFLGERLARVEAREEYGDLVCECELATTGDVTRAITVGGARTIDDIRRDVRVGMGPCQGGWCLPRVSGILHETLRPAVSETNVALRDFLAERWKGMVPILFGSQLRQARLDDLIFTGLLAVDSLTGPSASPLGPVMYEEVSDRSTLPTSRVTPPTSTTTVRALDQDVIVIGGGLAGLTAAWRAASAGASVTLLTKGWGSLVWHAGTIDVLGEIDGAPVLSPLEAIGSLAADHPYRLVGADALAAAVDALAEFCQSAGYPLIGDLGRNLELPTALGSARRTSLAPTTMAGGDLHRSDPMLIVGMSRFADLHSVLVADNLSARGIPATAMVIDVETLRQRRFVNGTVLAGLFDDERFRTEVVAAMEGRPGGAARIGFPAVLGMRDSPAVLEDLSRRLGAEVFEIPTLPPSVPGLRLQAILRSAITSAGGAVTDNAEVLELTRHDGGLEVTSASASRHQIHRARKVILATGGLLGGGIVGDADGTLREVVAGLDVTGPATRDRWFDRTGRDHPVYRAGVKTGEDLAAAPGVWVTGGLLGGHDPVREGSLEGVALATGWAAGERATS